MSVLETFRLTGKVAVVTGGNRGLGRAFALALGQAGATVAILPATPRKRRKRSSSWTARASSARRSAPT
jgi:NAD(P)-dependent dehydrogenase (short-subunit alcohol dehydrogenase family)